MPIACRRCGGQHWTKDCDSSGQASGYSKLSNALSPSHTQASSVSTRTETKELPLIGVFLGDIDYFITDVLKKQSVEGLAWLLAVAQGGGGSSLVDGSEEPDESVELPASFVTCPFVLVAATSCRREQAEIANQLKTLEALRFHCGCTIKVFSFHGPQPQPEWSFVFSNVIPAFAKQLQESEPQWYPAFDQVDGRNCWPRESQGPRVERVAMVPVFSSGGALFLFLVKPPQALGGAWTTIGGAPKRGSDGDNSILDTCFREWSEEVHAFSYRDAIDLNEIEKRAQWIVWKSNSNAWRSWRNSKPPGSSANDDGMSSTAWVFMTANEEFFMRTAGFEVDLVPKDLDVVRQTDARERFQLIHTKGLPFVEQEAGAWFKLDLDSGKLLSFVDGCEIRGDLGYTLLQFQYLRKRLSQFCKAEVATTPACGFCHHRVQISPEGLRNKKEVLRFSMAEQTPEESTKQLVVLISKAFASDKYHQFYSESVEILLEKGADPTTCDSLPADVPSILMAVILNKNLNENIAVRSVELLCQALSKRGHSISAEEKEALRTRTQSSSADLRSRWERLSERR